MQVNAQGLVKIDSLDRTLFMLLLQQKPLTLWARPTTPCNHAAIKQSGGGVGFLATLLDM